MTRVAAIDCGTNSLRLLISEVCVSEDAAGRPQVRAKDIHRQMEIVRLGEGVDARREFAPAALERTRLVLERYAELMHYENVVDVRMVATSATRDARNRAEFFDMTAAVLDPVIPGARAEVISGEQEAQLSFRGAVADLPQDAGPFLVIDLGGGSTEFMVGGADGTVLGAYSADMGCVRLSERILHSDPPTAAEIAAADAFVAEQLQQVRRTVPLESVRTIVGCAGTFTTLAALALGLESYDPAVIHGARLNFPALHTLTTSVLAEPAVLRSHHPVIHPGRADVLGGGCVVVQGILRQLGELTGLDSLLVSEHDILDGLVAELALHLA